MKIVTRGWGLAWGDVVEDGIWVYWTQFGIKAKAGRRKRGRGCGGGIGHTITGEQAISRDIQSSKVALRRRYASRLEWIGKGGRCGASRLGCDGAVDVVVWGEVGCQRGTM